MSHPTQAFVLCAGKGTRMHPDTLDRPKCLLDVAGQPVLAHILVWLKRSGIEEVLVNLHWKPETVLDYLAGHDFGLGVHCTVEDEIVGTAGGIRNCLEKLHRRFLVVYGDVLTNMDLCRLYRLHEGTGAALSLTSYRVDNPWDCGVIVARDDGRVMDIQEKPQREKVSSDLVNAGVMVCEKGCFELVPPLAPWDIAGDLIPALLSEGFWPIYHMPIRDEEWLIDMGTRTNYERLPEARP